MPLTAEAQRTNTVAFPGARMASAFCDAGNGELWMYGGLSQNTGWLGYMSMYLSFTRHLPSFIPLHGVRNFYLSLLSPPNLPYTKSFLLIDAFGRGIVLSDLWKVAKTGTNWRLEKGFFSDAREYPAAHMVWTCKHNIHSFKE